MRLIDVNNWNRKKQFSWFNSFSDPTYGMNVRMDVTKLVKLSKERGHSFFLDFLYIVMASLNEVPEMRLRIKDDKVVLYDQVNPSYIVSSDNNDILICQHMMTYDYKDFCRLAKKRMDEIKQRGSSIKDSFNEEDVVDDIYLSCVTTVDFMAVTHPIPFHSKNSMSIPRVAWGKYTKSGKSFFMTLNITVNHALVDGVPLSKAFLIIQEKINNAEKILR